MPEEKLNPVAAAEEPLEIEEKKKPEHDEDSLDQFISELTGDIQGDIKDRSPANRRGVVAYQLRRNQIGKKDKNFPFPNSSDLKFPIPEIKIREKRSGYVSVLFDTPKMVRFSPGKGCNPEAKDRLEDFYNWLLRVHIPRLKEKAAAGADKMLEQGKSFFKVTWAHDTEWKTRVFLKEDGDKLKSLIMQGKYAQWQQEHLPQWQQEHMEEILTAKQTGRPPPRPPQPDLKELEPTRSELLDGFMQQLQLDPDDEVQKKHAESTIDQYLDGKDKMTWMEESVVYRGPRIEPIPENQAIIVPINTGWIGDAERITHEMYFSKRELLAESKENGGRFNTEAVNALVKEYPNGSAPLSDDRLEMESARASAELIKQSVEFEGKYRLWEVCCWIPRKHISRFVNIGGNDDTPVRCVITYCPTADLDKVDPLRIVEFPYHHGEWFFHDPTYNYRIDRFYDAQGIPEGLDPFVREYNTSKNGSIDRTTLSSSPPGLLWKEMGITPQNYRQVGQAIMVNQPVTEGTIKVMDYPNLKDGLEFDAGAILDWCNRWVGSTDSSQFAGRQTSPTKSEVMAAQIPSNTIDHYEHSIWLETWTRMYRQLHADCKQFWFEGNAEEKFSFSKTDKPTERVEITAKDFEGEWIITAGGDPSKGDPQVELQKAIMGLQFAVQLPPVGVTVKMYRLIYNVYTQLYGYAQGAEIMQTEQYAEKAQQAVMQMAAQQVARQMQGKRPGRQAKTKNVPGVQTPAMAI